MLSLLSGAFAVVGFVAFLSASSGVARSSFGLNAQEYSYAFAGVVAPFLIVSIFSNHYIERIEAIGLLLWAGFWKRLAG